MCACNDKHGILVLQLQRVLCWYLIVSGNGPRGIPKHRGEHHTCGTLRMQVHENCAAFTRGAAPPEWLSGLIDRCMEFLAGMNHHAAHVRALLVRGLPAPYLLVPPTGSWAGARSRRRHGVGGESIESTASRRHPRNLAPLLLPLRQILDAAVFAIAFHRLVVPLARVDSLALPAAASTSLQPPSPSLTGVSFASSPWTRHPLRRPSLSVDSTAAKPPPLLIRPASPRPVSSALRCGKIGHHARLPSERPGPGERQPPRERQPCPFVVTLEDAVNRRGVPPWWFVAPPGLGLSNLPASSRGTLVARSSSSTAYPGPRHGLLWQALEGLSDVQNAQDQGRQPLPSVAFVPARTCPGYRNEFDLVFRNETLATEKRARKAGSKALARANGKAPASAVGPGPSWACPPSSSSTDGWLISPSPRVPVENRATCHFISNFVLLPSHGSVRGFMEFLIPLLKMEHLPRHFTYAFDACALASLNNRVGAGSDLDKEALGRYTKALSATNLALRDPAVARLDATLASVLLLGLFESIAARQFGTLAWGTHIEGAIELVKARGRKQLRTKLGLLMFIAVRTQMVRSARRPLPFSLVQPDRDASREPHIVYSITTSKAPVMGGDWWMNDTVRDRHAAECQRLNIGVGELRAEANRLLTSASWSDEHVQVVLDMIRRCQAHDLACANWSKTLPDSFRWRTVGWEDHVPNGNYLVADVYPGRVDAYPGLWVASVWNMMRCSRIVLASIIVRCVAWTSSPVDYRTTPEYATAARTCVDTITDIVASVPYQLGWFSKRRHLLDGVKVSSFACGEEDSPKGLGGYFMTWPLAVIHTQDYTTDSQRTWIRGRFEYIGHQLGVRSANPLTELNYRLPSMLIRRDGLMTDRPPSFHDLDKVPSGAAFSTSLPQRPEAPHRRAPPR
ncbi:Zn-C6 fungal-type DNA-binding domain protein [Drechmeria coniospora]|uniref:Zn-C6 fungal-type DNA-binding domain protein n=1 Tax=Drechmeria coniospora TaxID=98403 RepID=A0A151GG78_DRECN|nr:Zn-C6 fungal-type DNA-binding domain protein [Drechmeria coniospora]KYK56066.1 Zn-C6 fungal-type DNA-binding domain protein [Drechmeria coniospora]